jgi:hypothetical protein
MLHHYARKLSQPQMQRRMITKLLSSGNAGGLEHQEYR